MIKNKDIMIKVGAFPIVKENTIFKEAIEKMSEFNLGILCIVDNKFELRGIITDGDLRRMLLNIQKPFSAFFVDDIIKHSKKNPITSFPDEDIKKTLIKMNLSKLFMKITKDMGNNHFFGIPGSGVPLDLMDNGRDLGIDFINVAHESSAAIAAGTYGLLKDSAGLALAVKGVGAANLVGGIANGYFERLPVLCVCETTPSYSYENELVQHTDHKKIMGSLTKRNSTISTDNPTKTIIDSYKIAGSDIEGPVLIDFPSDLGLAEVAESNYKESKRYVAYDNLKNLINV